MQITKSPWREIVLSISSAIIGITIGPVIKSIFPSIFQHPNLQYLTFIITSLLFIIIGIFSITTFDRINSLCQQPRIKYIPVGKGKTDEIYKQVFKMLHDAKTEFLILNYHLVRQLEDQVTYDKTAKSSKDRKQYYQSFLKELEKKNPKEFRFCRMIQIPDNSKISNINDALLMKHFKDLVELGEQHAEFASLRKCPIFFEGTYIISDCKEMFWQVAAFNPEEQEYITEGYFILYDPTGELIKNFVNLFYRYEADATLVKTNEINYSQA